MRTRTTAAQRERIAELRERNWTKKAIAAELGLGINAVSYWLLVDGVEATKVPPPLPRGTGPATRNGKAVHPFTAEDDALIEAMALQQFNYCQIARHLTARDPARPRKPHTVQCRLLTIARRQERYGADASAVAA